MKINILIFSTLFLLFSASCSADDKSVSRDIANSKSIDELIEKMNQADEKYRYMYMNAIKSKIIALKESIRKKAMDETIEKIDEPDISSQKQSKDSISSGVLGTQKESMGIDSPGIGGLDGFDSQSGGMGSMGGGDSAGGMGGGHGQGGLR